MPLSVNDFADQADNRLFRNIKSQRWEELDWNLVNTRDRYGNTPLHAALGYGAPDSVLLRLLDLYPHATKMPGTDDWLPLHVAAMWGASAPVVERIIRVYPEALDDRGQGGIKGKSPRHLGVRFPHIKALVERPTAEWLAIIAGEQLENRMPTKGDFMDYGSAPVAKKTRFMDICVEASMSIENI